MDDSKIVDLYLARDESAIKETRKKYGANAIFKGRNLEKASTQLERNGQVGGHKA